MRESPRRREKRRQRFGGVDGGPAGLDAGLDKEKTGLSASARGCLVPAQFNGRVSVLKAAEERKPPARRPARRVYGTSMKKAQIRRRSPRRPARPCRFRRSADAAGFAEYPRRLAGSFADASDEPDLPHSPIYFITYVSSLRRRCYTHLGSVGRERPDRPPPTSRRCGVPRGQMNKLWRSV